VETGMDDIVSLIINGERITAHRNTTLLTAAREHGLQIPTLCYIESISAPGGCRLCLVEVEGSNTLQTACTTLVEQGMVVSTNSPRVTKYRKMIIELLLSEGNHVCTVCVANGTCELQGLAAQLGVDHVRFDYLHPAKQRDETHTRFVFDSNLCTLCARCVRVCDEVEHARTLDIAGKGIHSLVIMDMDDHWGNSATCTSCGKCLTVCPTGALFEKTATSADLHRTKHFMRYIESQRR